MTAAAHRVLSRAIGSAIAGGLGEAPLTKCLDAFGEGALPAVVRELGSLHQRDLVVAPAPAPLACSACIDINQPARLRVEARRGAVCADHSQWMSPLVARLHP